MNLQVYAEKAIVDASSTQDVNVYLVGVDESDILSALSTKQKLDSIDKGDILDYLHELELDEE